MWALPTLDNMSFEHLPGWMDDRSLWCLLLFPKAEQHILEGLRQNWDKFSQALGPKVHVITLLESAEPNSGQKLRFPTNYDAQVGKFCHELEVRLDHLPAVVLLNASDGRGVPYWSVKRTSTQLGSAALETLISDICSSTYHLPRNLDSLAWRTAAATKLLNAGTARETVAFLKANRKELMTLIQRLMRELIGHSS